MAASRHGRTLPTVGRKGEERVGTGVPMRMAHPDGTRPGPRRSGPDPVPRRSTASAAVSTTAIEMSSRRWLDATCRIAATNRHAPQVWSSGGRALLVLREQLVVGCRPAEIPALPVVHAEFA